MGSFKMLYTINNINLFIYLSIYKCCFIGCFKGKVGASRQGFNTGDLMYMTEVYRL